MGAFGQGLTCADGAAVLRSHSPQLPAGHVRSTHAHPLAVQHPPLQYADPTLLGEEAYPGLLSCMGGRCLMVQQQEAGDPCVDNSECFSYKCTNNVCQGLPYGSLCATGGCDASDYCKDDGTTAMCVARPPMFGGCSTLGQCPAGSICNLADNNPTCVPLFSAKTGTVVNTADLCSSGFMDANNICVDPPDESQVGKICPCGSTPSTPGWDCKYVTAKLA